MPAAFEKPPGHGRIVAALSARSHVPAEDVAALYEHERAALAAGARITKFLHIFAIHNVQEILRKRGHDEPSIRPGGPPLPALRPGHG